MPKISIEQAVQDIKAGKMVILVDDEDRENEGDLTMAAEKVDPQAINFMAKHARGLICLPMAGQLIDRLELPMMVNHNTSPFETGFTVSIEARCGVSTGISAADRATTIAAAIADGAAPGDLVRPGHVFPLRARKGGVMVRAGQTEGAVDLARLAGLKPAGVICEIMDEDGTMARMPALETFSAEHGIGICTIADLIEYRMRTESFIHRAVETHLPTAHAGDFRIIVYENDVEDVQHIALIKGEVDPDRPVLVRVHSECMIGDIFGSTRCDCGEQLLQAMAMMDREGAGVLLYIRQEGRGIGLINKIEKYSRFVEQGIDPGEMEGEIERRDMRHYGIGAQVLADLGVRKMRLITNNPKKMIGLEGYGLSVVEQTPVGTPLHDRVSCHFRCSDLISDDRRSPRTHG